MERRRVVVTGIGAVNALGLNVEEFADGLRAGRSGGAPISRFDASDAPVRIACEVKGFDPTTVLDRKTARRTDRYAHLAVAAAREAIDDAKLEIAAEADRIGASIGSGIGGLETLYTAHEHIFTKHTLDRFSPFWVPALIPNMGAAFVSIELGTRGPLVASCTACAASAMAVGDAVMYIRHGMADVMLAGGSEAAVTPMGVGGFAGMRALSTRNDDPAAASRPFDVGRDGLVIGEGAAVLVLEELAHAKARGARILAELTGYGLSSDASHVTEPDPTGVNPARAITMALGDAGRSPDEVDYVNAHATSTPVGDTAEARVLHRVFGEQVMQVPVSSTKSMTGHMLGAAGATEAVVCVLAITRGFLPPTINLDEPDPSCPLDHIPNVSRAATPRVTISNGFGFGGHNACLVIEAYAD
jgi:3-oxoacyl-[acyl-carrier-protein] synthase II